MALLEGVILFIIFVYLLYKYGTWNYSYWSSLGVYHLKPVPFLGTHYAQIMNKMSIFDDFKAQYDQLKGHRYGGIYPFRTPAILVLDPDLIKQITIKDFDHFMNKTVLFDEEVEPLFGKNLLSIRGQKWKDMRNTLSPAFTSSKMKNMFVLVNQIGQQLTEYVDEKLKEQSEREDATFTFEGKDFFTRFTCDVIATSAFGLKVDSLKEPDNEFYTYSKSVTNFSGKKFLLGILSISVPKLLKMLKITLFGEEISNFYRKLIKSTIREREEKKILRPDMIHLLMQAREGTLTDGTNVVPKSTLIDLSDDGVTAQAVLFLIAGFETSSTFLSFAAHELAFSPHVQVKLQEEVDRVVEENDGKFTYDGVINQMTYLEMVVSEVLRKWPSAVAIDRIVSKPYVLRGVGDEPDITLKVGDGLAIPIAGLHRDPEYFPDPDKFDPERFSEQNKNKIKPFTYMPFGSGPRSCIGNRFALMENKICLAHLMKKYTIVPVPETQHPIILQKSTFTLNSEKGFWLGLKRRTNC